MTAFMVVRQNECKTKVIDMSKNNFYNLFLRSHFRHLFKFPKFWRHDKYSLFHKVCDRSIFRSVDSRAGTHITGVSRRGALSAEASPPPRTYPEKKKKRREKKEGKKERKEKGKERKKADDNEK